MFLLIDNYDSFTYNLVQAFYSLDLDPYVVQNDDPNLLDLALRKDLEMVCISPGPGRPEEAGFCLKFLEALDPKVPVLGICLGHQILGCFAGAKVVNCPQIMHGKQSEITHEGEGLFKDLPDKMVVGRYHSLMVADEPSPKYAFKVTARGPRGEIMALNYQDRPWAGLQFHPESILTPLGMELLAHFPAALKQKEDDQVKIKEVLENLAQGQDLKPEQASFGFAKLMDGELSEAQAGSLLLTLRLKGESSLELAEAARQALKRAVTVPEIKEPHIDVVGTGGDGKHSFNCSTATSLVLAGLGYLVSKHGNRAVSSTCGSADAIQGLGLPMQKEAQQILAELKKRHFAFLFAQNFHPSFKNVAKVRKELGVRTLFNLLGPFLNPARPTHLLMGVGDPKHIPLVCETLIALKQPVAAVVCGAGIYDEVTPLGVADVTIIRQGQAQPLYLNPKDFGIKPCRPTELEVHSKREAVEVLRELLSGHGPAPMLDMIVLNVGLALYLLEETWNLAECMAYARDAVMKGVGQKVLYAG